MRSPFTVRNGKAGCLRPEMNDCLGLLMLLDAVPASY